MGSRAYKGLQRVNRSYKMLQAVTGVKEVTEGYKGF